MICNLRKTYGSRSSRLASRGKIWSATYIPTTFLWWPVLKIAYLADNWSRPAAHGWEKWKKKCKKGRKRHFRNRFFPRREIWPEYFFSQIKSKKGGDVKFPRHRNRDLIAREQGFVSVNRKSMSHRWAVNETALKTDHFGRNESTFLVIPRYRSPSLYWLYVRIFSFNTHKT